VKTIFNVLPTRWRQKPAGIDKKGNYVIVTLCIHSVHAAKTRLAPFPHERRRVTDSRGSLPCKTPTGSSYSQVDDVITESDDVTAVSYDVAGYCACALQTRSVNGRQLQVRHVTSFTTQSLRQSVIIIANDRCGGGVDQRSGGRGGGGAVVNCKIINRASVASDNTAAVVI